uniref:vacuolar protein sorting-associated protein 26C n=1 Tax=Myxine glutinosa TaxID=7769 RepID=UPI00358F60F2
MALSLDIRLKRASKVYSRGEILAGVVVVQCKETVQHQGISLTMDGSVTLQLSSKTIGVFEAFYNSAKPITLVNCSAEVCKPGRLPLGRTEIPFEFPIEPQGSQKVLYETYHGLFINIQYILRCDMKRSILNKDLQKTCEFIIHIPSAPETLPSIPVKFLISPESLQNVPENVEVPVLRARGELSATQCSLARPLTGWLTLERCDLPLRSIELQLIRVETCGCAEGYGKELSEVQRVQVADGEVCRGLPILLHMHLPRLFTCSTLNTSTFKIEFELNIIIVLKDDHMITENFPLKLVRN